MKESKLKPWKTLSTENLLDSRWLRVDKETCELPTGKVISDFYTIWQPDWVLILAEDAQGRFLMERQYRQGTHSISLEFPAGIIDKGETPLEAAKRELQEECAHGGGAWKFLREFPMNPDRHRGRFFVVSATGVLPSGNTHFDSTENIETLFYSKEQVLAAIRSCEMNHPHQIASFLLYLDMYKR
ncbi:MAG: NUDIX hydrolase [Fibrobacteraceae bacterium]